MTLASIRAGWVLVALALSLAVDWVLAQQPRIPPKYKASPIYVAQLPKFCWAQYVDGAFQGYEFSIPNESCGPEMNHFCPALVYLLQAQSPTQPMRERRGDLGSAIREIEYTLRGMKPGCFIANEVRAARMRAQALTVIVK